MWTLGGELRKLDWAWALDFSHQEGKIVCIMDEWMTDTP